MTDQQAFYVAILALLTLALLVGVVAFFMGSWVGLLAYALTLVAVIVGAAI